MAASRYSVGMGPVPVPPERSGSSTTKSNPPAATRHRQPPSHRAVTELVCGPLVGVRELAASVAMRVVVPVVMPGGPPRQLVQPGLQVVGSDQPRPAHQPLQGAQPALVVVPALPGRVGGFPVADLTDQRLAEILPVDAPGVVQRERDAERLALPRRGEHQLAVVAGRSGRADRIEQVGSISIGPRTAREGHGTATSATPTMASRVTRAASSASEYCSVPAGRS